MVTTFAVLLSIIFILEVAAGALGLAYRKKVRMLPEVLPCHFVLLITQLYYDASS